MDWGHLFSDSVPGVSAVLKGESKEREVRKDG
jgi:hypothetical protein